MEYTRGRFGSSGVVSSRSEDGAELEPLLFGIDSVARITGDDGGLDLTGFSVLVALVKLGLELLAPGGFRTEAHVVGCCCALLCCNPAKGTNANIEFASAVVFSAMSKFVATSKLT